MASYSNPQGYQRLTTTSTTTLPSQNYRQGEKAGSPTVSSQNIQRPSATTSAPRPFAPRRFNTGTSQTSAAPYQAQNHSPYEQHRQPVQQLGYPGYIGSQAPAYYGSPTAQPGQQHYYSDQEYNQGFNPYTSYHQRSPQGTGYYPPHAPVTPPYTGLEETKLTERGQEFPFKDMLMARYQQMEASGQFPPVQLLSSEASLVSDKVLINDMHQRQPLASSIPFNSEELGAIATGQFVHHQQRRPGGTQQHGQRRDYTHTRNQSYNRHNEEEGEEILWGAESIQTGQLGTFDASGQFIETTKMPPPLKPIIPTTPITTSMNELPGDNRGRSTKTFTESSSAAPPGFGPAPPVVTSATQWVYRDPLGILQGPFLNAKMLEWYQAGYFPDNLPLRRDTDSFFDTLSAWKIKCGGRVPFEATSPIEVRAPPKKPQEVKPELGKSFEIRESVQPKVAEAKPKQGSESERFLAGLVTGKLDNLSLREEPKKSISVEQLEAQIKPTAPKKDSPVILQRSTETKQPFEEVQHQQADVKTPKSYADLIGKPVQEQEYKTLPIKKPSSQAASETARPRGEESKRRGMIGKLLARHEKPVEASKAKEIEGKPVQPGKKVETASQVQHWLQNILASTSQSLDVPTCVLCSWTCPAWMRSSIFVKTMEFVLAP